MMSDLLTVLSLSLDSLRSHFVVIFSDSHCCKFVVSHCSVSGFLGLIASFFNYNIRIVRIGVNSFLRILYGAEFSAQRTLQLSGPDGREAAGWSRSTGSDGSVLT